MPALQALLFCFVLQKDGNKGNKPNNEKKKLFSKTTQAAIWYFKPACINNVRILAL